MSNPQLSASKRSAPSMAVTPGTNQRQRVGLYSTPITRGSLPTLELFRQPPTPLNIQATGRPPPVLVDRSQQAILDIFDYTPFGLYCRSCKVPSFACEFRPVQHHLRKHHKTVDNKQATIDAICQHFSAQIIEAKSNRSIEPFLDDTKNYNGFVCFHCGMTFQRKSSAIRHCNSTGHDKTRLIKQADFKKLKCGRFVSPREVNALFNGDIARSYKQKDYKSAREILSPYLNEKEKGSDTYTHLFEPLIFKCAGASGFEEKIQDDCKMIHGAVDSTSEALLVDIHENVENWLLKYSTKNVLQVPGDIRAALQTFEGGEVNEISQQTTYTMQFFAENLVAEAKRLLAFAYRRGYFSKFLFDSKDPYATQYFLKELLLEKTDSVGQLPLLAEYGLMSVFRVPANGTIGMVSCGTLSSVLSKICSICRAAVCSVICSFTTDFHVRGRDLVHEIRTAAVIHILSPMVRQVRDMSTRVPSSRKKSQDKDGNIYVDQYVFDFDTWSRIATTVLDMMKKAVSLLVQSDSWEQLADWKHRVFIDRNLVTGELSFRDQTIEWKEDLNPSAVDRLCALMELSLHGFGGGSARGSELGRPSMFHALWHAGTVYYACESIKVFNGKVLKFREVERKLPPSIARFFLIFRSLVQARTSLFETDHLNMLPKIKGTKVNSANLIKEIFNLDRSPDMTQVRHFWAGVSNRVAGGKRLLTASEMGAAKMGHSFGTHIGHYSNEGDVDEAHYDSYHFAIGDESHSFRYKRSEITIFDIRAAMQRRYPNGDSSKSYYLSVQQKDLVEFGYGGGAKPSHCVGLLGPGQGKSECYLLPTISRALAEKDCKTIVYIAPYNFLAAFQHAKALTCFQNLDLSEIEIGLYSSSDFEDRENFPVNLENEDDLPSIIFMNLDAMYALYKNHKDSLRGWANSGVLDRIVIDEFHSILSEQHFREKFKVFQYLASLKVPILALSGTVPKFLVSPLLNHLCISTTVDNTDVRIINSGDIVGRFPVGFEIQVAMVVSPLNPAVAFVKRCLGSDINGNDAVHILASTTTYAQVLFHRLENRYKTRLVTAKTSKEEVLDIARDWSNGAFECLISTSIGLVGVENPKCKFLCCAGCMYDKMQVVQFFGRLRDYQRKEDGRVYFAIQTNMAKDSSEGDAKKRRSLEDARIIMSTDGSSFDDLLTPESVHKWATEAAKGGRQCAMKSLSSSFGYAQEDCGACKYCRTSGLSTSMFAASRREAEANVLSSAASELLSYLSHNCACGKVGCVGVPLQGEKNHCLPDRSSCYDCILRHCRNGACPNRGEIRKNTYMNGNACSRCWVYKEASPIVQMHLSNECQIKGRLRRLFAIEYSKASPPMSFEEYVAKIYVSKESFQRYLSDIKSRYIG